MTRETGIPTESQEQQALIRWTIMARRSYMLPAPPYPPDTSALDLLYAVPNGGHRHRVTAAKLKGEGVKRGVPDLVLPLPVAGSPGLYIELKRIKGGLISPEQQWWRQVLRAAGYRMVVCRGWVEARDVIASYLAPLLHRVAA